MLLGVSAAVFFGVAALPGDAATQAAGAQAPQRVAELRSQFGLDTPVWERYFYWWNAVAHGTFGTSLPSGEPVRDLLSEPVQASVALGVHAVAIMLVVGVGLGIWAGVSPDTMRDRGISFGALVAISSPEFVVATLAIVVFADQLGWFPSVSLLPIGGSVWDDPMILVLPALCLGFYGAAGLSRLVRGAVRVAYDQPYVASAELAGVSPVAVVRRHLLPTAWGPIAQAAAQFVPYVLGGAVVIERVFGYPGVGSLLVDRIAARDEAAVVTIVMALSLVTVFGYLLADACVSHFDRRMVGFVDQRVAIGSDV